MCTSKHKSASYRRNRDYFKQFNWTYELNEDLYKYYTEAREVPKKGYMTRMKKMWDKLHPELNHFTEKYLRQQATYTKKQGYLYKLLTLLIATQKIQMLKQIYKLKNKSNKLQKQSMIVITQKLHR